MKNSKWQTKNDEPLVIGYRSPEYRDLMELHSLCRSGSAMDILLLMKICEYDDVFLTSKFLISISGPIPIHRISTPLWFACDGHNLQAIIALLELGADPDLEEWDEEYISNKNSFCKDREISKLLCDGKFWWSKRYSDTRKHALKEEFESCIRNHEYCTIIWHLIRGMRLDSPEILAENSFDTFPRTMKDMVCHVGIPQENAKEFYYWLHEHTSCLDTIASMKSAASRNHDEMDIALENIRFSLDLMDNDSLFDAVQSTLPQEEQILLLKWLADHYEKTDDKRKVHDFFMRTLWKILDNILIQSV